MPRFELKQSTRHITSYADRFLVNRYLGAARLELPNQKFPASQGQLPASAIVKSYMGLAGLGQKRFRYHRTVPERAVFPEGAANRQGAVA